MRIHTFDIESRLSTADLSQNEDHAWDLMRLGHGGISMLAIHDSSQNWIYTYDDHELEEVAHNLELADVVVGYGSYDFDVPVIESLLKRKLILKNHIDIYKYIHYTVLRAGRTPRRKEYSLESVAIQNLGRGKIDTGANVSELIRQGKWGRLTRYCIEDVHLTWDLFNHIKKNGGFKDSGGVFLPLTLPGLENDDIS